MTRKSQTVSPNTNKPSNQQEPGGSPAFRQSSTSLLYHSQDLLLTLTAFPNEKPPTLFITKDQSYKANQRRRIHGQHINLRLHRILTKGYREGEVPLKEQECKEDV